MTAPPASPATTAIRKRSTRQPHVFRRQDDPLTGVEVVGSRDQTSIEDILTVLPGLPVWPSGEHQEALRYLTRRGVRVVLNWLAEHPGDGWQQRWRSSGAGDGMGWVDELAAKLSPGQEYHRRHNRVRHEIVTGLCYLMLCRAVVPSYEFLAAYRAHHLFTYARQVFRPDLFAKIEAAADAVGVHGRRRLGALGVLCKIVLRTGRDLDQLTGEDLLAYRTWEASRYRMPKSGVGLAWLLVRGIADLGGHATIRDALRLGQRPTAELVDRWQLRCRPVRGVLVRYLDERRPGLDYSTLRGMLSGLVGNFWADIEQHHPDIDTLRLPDEVATAWKQRLKVIIQADGTTRPRKDYFDILLMVRSFYLDIQEWAHQDPFWAAWAAPSPVRRGDAQGQHKSRQQRTAASHQRIRERLPHLPVLADFVEQSRQRMAALLAAAAATGIGQDFTCNDRQYRRTAADCYITGRDQGVAPPSVQVIDLQDGETINVTKAENDAFWTWAVVETLRHTGVRVEELVEITHLAVISYRLQDTGETVPMLQILPSKSNEERLLLIGPELASVLATIITRLRNANDGTVPLTARYDPHERIVGPELPHLFQRRAAWRWEVITDTTIRKMLNRALAGTHLRDAAGKPLKYTPHDFRRMFATEAVSTGLPVHIAARLLGHANINVTQGYLAVFEDELVRAYQAFLTRRRAARPQAEHREATDEEWREFEQHFHTRKLELGTCGRPYGTPCRHEHVPLTELTGDGLWFSDVDGR